MKLHLVIAAIFLIAGCGTHNQKGKQKNGTFSFYVGTYNSEESRGIYKYLLQNDGSLKRVGLAAISDNPSFLAMSADKRFLVCTNEVDRNDTGSVMSFLVSGDSLEFISQSSSGGAHPCFVSVNETGFVLAANYTGGNVGLLKLNKKGKLSSLLDVQQHTGSGSTDRQQSPHAHSAWFDPNDNDIISVDLGTNELWLSQLDTGLRKLLPSDPHTLKMAPGAGPRHLVFHPNGKWIYVVNELDCTVTLVQKTDAGKYEKGAFVSTLPLGYSETNTCADIHISSDAKFVYASNRGHNSIAIFKVIPENGQLIAIGHQNTHGSWPRNFSLSPDNNYLLVANQYSDNIVSFKRDNTSGLMEYVSEIEAPVPVCIIFQ